MSVYRKKGSPYWWFDYQYKGRRQVGSTGCESEAKATKYERDHRERIALDYARDGGWVEPAAPAKTLLEAATTWWAMKGQALGRAHDEKDRRNRLARAVDYVGGDKPVLALTTADVATAIQRRRGVLVKPHNAKGPGHVAANATVNRDIIETIRPVINHAADLADVAAPPIKWGTLREKTNKPKARDFSDEGVADFVAALPEHWRAFAHIGLRYGLRCHEMFFHPREVELRRLVILDRKADDDHFIPLHPDDAAMLNVLAQRAIDAGLDTVWFRELKGWKYNAPAEPRLKALKYNSAIWAFRQAVRKAELPGAKGSHDMRRNAAMKALRASGGNLRAVQKLLGHADIKSTMVYAHALEEDVRGVIDAVVGSHKIPTAASAGEETAARSVG